MVESVEERRRVWNGDLIPGAIQSGQNTYRSIRESTFGFLRAHFVSQGPREFVRREAGLRSSVEGTRVTLTAACMHFSASVVARISFRHASRSSSIRSRG